MRSTYFRFLILVCLGSISAAKPGAVGAASLNMAGGIVIAMGSACG